MKTKIKSLYIEKLQATYPFYTEGSRQLNLANESADAALSGRMALKGDCWNAAVSEVTGWKRWTMAQMAGLPE